MARYLEHVSNDDDAATSLAKVWQGQSEEDGILQMERLDLRPDGTFDHRVRQRFERSNDDSVAECSGHWEVHKVRHMGADLQREGDREILFKGTPPLICERLVVCGTNPLVNGFLGASCRLFPLENDEEAEAEEVPEDAEAEEAEEVPEEGYTENDVNMLMETTGQPRDRCVAALMEEEGGGLARLEAAAARLMDDLDAQDEASGASSSQVRPVNEESLQMLMACTGRSEADCRAALQRYSSVDRAAETLLLTDASAAETADAPADAPVEPEPKRPRTE